KHTHTHTHTQKNTHTQQPTPRTHNQTHTRTHTHTHTHTQTDTHTHTHTQCVCSKNHSGQSSQTYICLETNMVSDVCLETHIVKCGLNMSGNTININNPYISNSWVRYCHANVFPQDVLVYNNDKM